MARRGGVGEARERPRRLLDAAGHGQRVVAQRVGDGQVGELGVEVLQVRGAALRNGDGTSRRLLPRKNVKTLMAVYCDRVMRLDFGNRLKMPWKHPADGETVTGLID